MKILLYLYMGKIEDIIEKWESYGLLDDDLVNKKNMALTFNELMANKYIVNNENKDLDMSFYFAIFRKLIRDIVDDLDVEMIKKIIEFTIKDFTKFWGKHETQALLYNLSFYGGDFEMEVICHYFDQKNIDEIIKKLKSKSSRKKNN